MKIERLANLIATGLARVQDLDEAGPDAVREAKMSLDLPFLRTRAADPISVDDESRVIRYVWSDETVDRYGDIIRASGWETTDYDANPIALFMHDMEKPIGNGVGYAVEGKQLVGGIRFAPAGSSQQADEAYALAKAGVLKAVSVGFDPLERVWHDDDDERRRLGLGTFGVEYTKQRLLEISLVSIPANPSATQLALRQLVDAGSLSDQAAERFLAQQVTELDWAKRARAIRRRSVTVEQPDYAARIAALEHEVRRLGVLAIGTRATDSARERAEAAEAEARAAARAVMEAATCLSIERAFVEANKEARKGSKQ